MSLSITCSRCKNELTHSCNEDLTRAVKYLRSFQIEFLDLSMVGEMRKSPYYVEGDEESPFFSEAFLYPLLGKEDARSVLGAVNMLLRAAGIEPHSKNLRPEEGGNLEPISLEYDEEAHQVETSRLKGERSDALKDLEEAKEQIKELRKEVRILKRERLGKGI